MLRFKSLRPVIVAGVAAAALMAAGCAGNGIDPMPAEEIAAEDARAVELAKPAMIEIVRAQEAFYERFGTFTASWDDLHVVSPQLARLSTSYGSIVGLDWPFSEVDLRTAAGGQSYRASIDGDFGVLEAVRDPVGVVRFPCRDLPGCRDSAEGPGVWREPMRVAQTRAIKLVPFRGRTVPAGARRLGERVDAQQPRRR